MKTKFKKGDRVLITKSPYEGHASRKAGGTGTIREVYTYVNTAVYIVDVDDDPPDFRGSEGDGWDFNDDELAAAP